MFNKEDISILNEWLITPQNIVITAHKSADGDSIGSSLALLRYLTKKGHKVSICHPDGMPDFYKWLLNSDSIITYDSSKKKIDDLLNQADIIFCLDYNHPSRVGDMSESLFNSQAKKVMIDHHRDPDKASFDLIFSDHEICSTCEMIYHFIDANNDISLLSAEIGTPMYCGIMTDTGSFRFPSTTATTHRIIANLIEVGVVNHQIHENVFDTNTLNQIQLVGYALSNKLTILDQYNVAYISLSQSELKKYNAVKGDTEGLVNKALAIEGIKMAIFIKEDTEIIKMSFRSKSDIYVNELAKTHFNGGGHKYAAGGMFEGELEMAIKKLVTVIPEYVK